MKLYKVEFTFADSYRPKAEGFLGISLVVLAMDQFSALQQAWERISGLGLPEPESFNAKRCDRD